MTANRAMALRIVWGTRLDDHTPAPDARQLLEMCGLVQPGGHEIAPDIVGGIRVPSAGKPKGNLDEPTPRTGDEDDDPPPSKRLTTPPGLRDLPPVAAPVKRAAAPKAAPVCGTRSGYMRHRRLGEEACRPCKDSNTKRQRKAYREEARLLAAGVNPESAAVLARKPMPVVAAPPAPEPIKPDDWLATAQRSPDPAVARAAAKAIGARIRLEMASTVQLADGAHAQNRTTRRSTRAAR